MKADLHGVTALEFKRKNPGAMRTGATMLPDGGRFGNSALSKCFVGKFLQKTVARAAMISSFWVAPGKRRGGHRKRGGSRHDRGSIPHTSDMPESSIEAARYALLRRLAPAIRHRVVGRLHPIGLIAEAVEWQVQDAAPNLANVRENIAKIKSLSQTAMQSFTTQITWLARENGAITTIGDGVDECLALLHTDFELRGFAIENQIRAPGLSVSLNALRNVLTSALIAVTDAAPGPAILTLTADVSNQHIVLSIVVRPTEGDPGISNDGAYRPLDWDDVDALAHAESVKITRHGERVEMRYSVIDKDIAGKGSPAT